MSKTFRKVVFSWQNMRLNRKKHIFHKKSTKKHFQTISVEKKNNDDEKTHKNAHVLFKSTLYDPCIISYNKWTGFFSKLLSLNSNMKHLSVLPHRRSRHLVLNTPRVDPHWATTNATLLTTKSWDVANNMYDKFSASFSVNGPLNCLYYQGSEFTELRHGYEEFVVEVCADDVGMDLVYYGRPLQ